VIAFEPVLAVDGLLGADESKLQVAESCAIIGVPAVQHGLRNLAGNAADRGALPGPARRRIADPGLAVALSHVLDMDAADPVRQIMILRGGDRRRQVIDAKLLQPRQKTLLLLATKYPEHELGGLARAAARHHRERKPGEERMIELRDAAPF